MLRKVTLKIGPLMRARVHISAGSRPGAEGVTTRNRFTLVSSAVAAATGRYTHLSNSWVGLTHTISGALIVRAAEPLLGCCFAA